MVQQRALISISDDPQGLIVNLRRGSFPYQARTLATRFNSCHQLPEGFPALLHTTSAPRVGILVNDCSALIKYHSTPTASSLRIGYQYSSQRWFRRERRLRTLTSADLRMVHLGHSTHVLFRQANPVGRKPTVISRCGKLQVPHSFRLFLSNDSRNYFRSVQLLLRKELQLSQTRKPYFPTPNPPYYMHSRNFRLLQLLYYWVSKIHNIDYNARVTIETNKLPYRQLNKGPRWDPRYTPPIWSSELLFWRGTTRLLQTRRKYALRSRQISFYALHFFLSLW